jgi:acyl carrier protein
MSIETSAGPWPGGRVARPAEFAIAMLAWLEDGIVPPGSSLTVDTPLFESGLINSLRILQLIAWTERAIGRRIQDEEIVMENFGSVARIAQTFAGGGHVDR